MTIAMLVDILHSAAIIGLAITSIRAAKTQRHIITTLTLLLEEHEAQRALILQERER